MSEIRTSSDFKHSRMAFSICLTTRHPNSGIAKTIQYIKWSRFRLGKNIHKFYFRLKSGLSGNGTQLSCLKYKLVQISDIHCSVLPVLHFPGLKRYEHGELVQLPHFRLSRIWIWDVTSRCA